MKGGKLLALIIACGWVASILLTAYEKPQSFLYSPFYVALEALVAAVFIGLLAWLASDKTQPLSLIAKPICWTFIVLGILGFGRAYGIFRDEGLSPGIAAFYAFTGVQGGLIAAGVTALLFRRKQENK
ncbi:MAG: hypothetical protein WCJ41_20335 [Aestuariivirga sp.]|uniref:hypothetical protein n=1 Tax=Aestuariivirga sp. TaxID=2650926 RepID=UPI0030190E2E